MISTSQDTITQHPPTAARPQIGLIDPTTYRISLHLMADLVIGTITFTLIVTLLALAADLMITLAGIPILVGTLLVARGIGEFERRRANAALAVEAAAPVHTSRRVRDRLRDRADWRAVVYAAALFPVGVFTGTITLAGWATAAAAITSPFYLGLIDSVPRVAGISLDDPIGVVATVLGGLILLVVMPAVVKTLARLDAILVQRLLARKTCCSAGGSPSRLAPPPRAHLLSGLDVLPKDDPAAQMVPARTRPSDDDARTARS